jgi:hypothetical protein
MREKDTVMIEISSPEQAISAEIQPPALRVLKWIAAFAATLLALAAIMGPSAAYADDELGEPEVTPMATY